MGIFEIEEVFINSRPLLSLFQLDPSKMDRVELAFRKFDTNNDGYLSRDEFDVVMYKDYSRLYSTRGNGKLRLSR